MNKMEEQMYIKQWFSYKLEEELATERSITQVNEAKHRREIDNLKLVHAQELYIQKKKERKLWIDIDKNITLAIIWYLLPTYSSIKTTEKVQERPLRFSLGFL